MKHSLTTALLLLLTCLLSVQAERDYYEVLGLTRDATEADVKKAYKKLAMQYHPDKNKEPDAEQKFMEVTNAYQILSDPENRKKYDTYGHSAFNQGGGPGGGMKFNFGDPFHIFQTFFGGGFGGDGGQGMKFSFNFGGDQGSSGGFGGFPGGGHHHSSPPPPQPGQPLYSQNTEVTLLNEDNFQLTVVESDHAWLIQFFLPDCSECHNLATVYEKVATSLKHIVNVGAVDCAKDKSICQKYDIKKVPEIILIPYGKENRQNIQRYTGSKTSAMPLHDFALTGLPQTYITTLRLHTEYTSFISDLSKPKLMLFSKKTSPPPLFISLSLLFKDRIKLGFVPQSSAAGKVLYSEHSVSDWPSVIAISADGTAKEIYSGEMSYPSLSMFINKIYRASKKKGSTATATVVDEVRVFEDVGGEMKKECSAGLCGLYLTSDDDNVNADERTEVMKKLITKYARQKCKFGIMTESGAKKFRDISENAAFVVLNGKSGKIASTKERSFDGIVLFLDRVFGGSERWMKIDTSQLMQD